VNEPPPGAWKPDAIREWVLGIEQRRILELQNGKYQTSIGQLVSARIQVIRTAES
jgi:hypothetical protein